MKHFITIAFLALMVQTAHAQGKTYAFFMIGNYASPAWEKLEFELKGQGREIKYVYRANEQGHKLEMLGTQLVGGQKALRVKIRSLNKTYLIIRNRQKKSLTMTSEDGTYKKQFALGYEGPVDGRGTFCESCANEPADAFKIVDSFF